MAKKGSDLVGTACAVTDGPNKGKTGTYTVDEEGNLWCEGDWGGTQCATKCTSAATSVGQLYDYASTGGDVRYEADGLFTNAAGDVFHVQAELDAKTKKTIRVVTAKVLPTPISSLKKSKSALDRALGAAIESQLTK